MCSQNEGMKPLQVNKSHDILAWVNFPIICYSLLIFVGKEFWHSIVTSIKLIFQVWKRTSTNKWECLILEKTENYFQGAWYKSCPEWVWNKKEIKTKTVIFLKAVVLFCNLWPLKIPQVQGLIFFSQNKIYHAQLN